MLVYRASLERKQAFLFRVVDIAMNLFVMATTISRAEAMTRRADRGAQEAQRLASTFCDSTERSVTSIFHELWRNDDAVKYRLGRSVLDGAATWLEEGAVPLGVDAEQMRPRATDELGVDTPSAIRQRIAEARRHAG
jgi:hypothetical protein